MDFILIYIEQILWLVLLVILVKNWLKMRIIKTYLGGSLLFFSILLCLSQFFYHGLMAVLLWWVISLIYLCLLFDAAFWQLLLASGLLCLAYLLSGRLFLSLFQSPGMDLSFNGPLEFFLADLYAQICLYAIGMLAGFARRERDIPFTYCLPLMPILFSIGFLICWKRIDTSTVDTRILYLVLFGLASLDFFCLVIQSWMIASIETRRKVRREKARREQLMAKYDVLQAEYAVSFGFLHDLLRQCADLSQKTGQNEAIGQIALAAFARFNSLAIITPSLEALLEARKEKHLQQHIYVSALLQSDHFGLMTRSEQDILFGSLLDFMEQQALRKQRSVQTLALRSASSEREIYLTVLFPCSDPAPCRQQFLQLQKKLSRLFHAGLSLQFPSSEQGQIEILIPIDSWKLKEDPDF